MANFGGIYQMKEGDYIGFNDLNGRPIHIGDIVCKKYDNDETVYYIVKYGVTPEKRIGVFLYSMISGWRVFSEDITSCVVVG